MTTDFVRSAAAFLNAVSSLEDELKRMREKKLPQDLVDKKDLQIEDLVKFYNSAHETVEVLKLQLAQARIENHFLTEMLCKKVSLQELMDYKPSKKVLIINSETAEGHTLTDYNGET